MLSWNASHFPSEAPRNCLPLLLIIAETVSLTNVSRNYVKMGCVFVESVSRPFLLKTGLFRVMPLWNVRQSPSSLETLVNTLSDFTKRISF